MIRIKKPQDIWIDLRWSVIQESRNTKKMAPLNKSNLSYLMTIKKDYPEDFLQEVYFQINSYRTSKRITKEVTFTD